jgi:hypothetical protein
MLGYISMPGGIELLVLLPCFLIPVALVVVIILLIVKLSKQTPAGPAVTCPRCGHPNPAAHRFCSQCGQNLQNPTSQG